MQRSLVLARPVRAVSRPLGLAPTLGARACLYLAPAAIAAGGGTKPSTAPAVAIGQQYFGSIGSSHRTEFWRLPVVTARDVVTMAWSTSELTQGCVKTNIDDYSWDTGDDDLCGGGYGDENGRRFRMTVEESATDAFLVFDDPVWGGQSSEDAPYEFTVEGIQHWLGVGMRRQVRISRRGTLSATITTGDNVAAPDGIPFTLTARWGKRTRTYEGTTAAGRVSFKLALPRTAIAKKASFVVSRAEDATYLAATSKPQRIRVR
jgi:hypothetical protein